MMLNKAEQVWRERFISVATGRPMKNVEDAMGKLLARQLYYVLKKHAREEDPEDAYPINLDR